MKQKERRQVGCKEKVCTLGESNENAKTVIYQRYGNKNPKRLDTVWTGSGRVSRENLDDDGSKINQRKEHRHKSSFGADELFKMHTGVCSGTTKEDA